VAKSAAASEEDESEADGYVELRHARSHEGYHESQSQAERATRR
jgi:hypothetical protein